MAIDQSVAELNRTIAALAARMEALEARVREQDSELAALRARAAPGGSPAAPAAGLSRRQLLRRMGAVIAAGAAAGALGLPAAALAAVKPGEDAGPSTTGEPLLIGRSNLPTAPADTTSLVNPSQTTLASRMLRVANYTTNDAATVYATGNNRIGLIASVSGADDNTTMTRMAIVGVTDGDIGVVGRSTSTSGSASGVYGEAVNGTGLEGVATGAAGWGIYARGGQYGGLLQGNVAPLRLQPFTVAGAPTSGAHSRGEFIVDSRGDLYFCTTSGSPGTWVRLTPVTTALPLVSK